MRHPSALAFLWPCVFAASGIRAHDLLALLLAPANRWSENTTISSPDQKGFQDRTARWTIFSPPTYAASISPATEEDVAKAVNISTRNGIPFLATGGRHGLSVRLAKVRDGLSIDLSQLNSVKVNKNAGTLTIGGGALNGQIFGPVQEAGFEIQTGSCSCTGFVGVTLGGGVGRYSGLYGIVSDALVSVRLVTADGRVVHASETTHPDLFWALRGAGANYGIVTSATYKLQCIGSQSQTTGHVVNADIIITPDKAGEYFRALEGYGGVMPANLAAISVVAYDQRLQAPYILANWVHMSNNEAEARKAIAPILALSEPSMTSISVIPWSQVIATQGFGIDQVLCVKGVTRDVYSTNVRNLSASALESAFNKMAAFYAAYPAAQGSALQLETFPNQGALAAGSAGDAGSYPWRDAVGNFLFMFAWKGGDSSVADAVAKLGPELRNSFKATSGYPGLSVSVNYARGDEKAEEIYGKTNLARLGRLKRRWDPNNVFSFGNAVPLVY